MLNHRDYMPKASENKRDLFLELVSGTDAVCDACLDEEYRELCREMAADLVRRGRFVFKGRIQSWVSGIVHAVGWVNYLDDPAQSIHMSSAELAKSCGMSHSTMMDKSRQIRKFLRIVSMDPRWCRSDMLLDNPLVWMLEVDGVIMDLRTAPRKLQVAAFQQGLIPFIPPEHEPQLQVKEPGKVSSPTSKKKAATSDRTLDLFNMPTISSDDGSEDI